MIVLFENFFHFFQIFELLSKIYIGQGFLSEKYGLELTKKYNKVKSLYVRLNTSDIRVFF